MRFFIRDTLIILLVFGGSIALRAQTVLTLQNSLQMAKDNNLALKSQQLNIDASQSDIRTAKLYPNPVLSNQTIQMTDAAQFAPNTDWNNANNRQTLWQLNQPIMIAGQRKWKVDIAEKKVTLSQRDFEEFERNLLRDVAQKWLDAWGSYRRLNILEMAKGNIDTLVYINKLRVKNEAITKTELVRAELLAGQYDMQIKSARQDYRNRLAILQNQLMLQGDITIDPVDAFLPEMDEPIDSLLRQAMNYRSDIRSLQMLNTIAASNIRMQKSQAWPQPTVGVIWNPQNSIQYWGFFAGIELPIFSRNQGEIRKSKILEQKAGEDLYVAQLQAQTEINNAYHTFQTQQKNVERLPDMLAQSEQILNSVQYAYLHGGTTIIDFLEAQRSWLDVRMQYYDILQQYRGSYIDVLYASGLINRMVK